jgi:hypothetical protein
MAVLPVKTIATNLAMAIPRLPNNTQHRLPS